MPHSSGAGHSLLALKKRLTLGELEALACFWTTWLFAFYNAWVAGHEAFCAECFLILWVDLDESAGDSETECLCLSFVAASVKVYADVVFFFCLKGFEGLLYDVLEDGGGEVLVKRAMVDSDFAVAFGKDHAGDGCFTAAYCINCFHCSTLG